jgi:hypothetical protein
MNILPPGDPSRIASVDALRGVAALAVAWFHVYTQNGGALAGDAMPQAFSIASVWGRWGVQLFFVISGFVITYTMLHRRDVAAVGDIGRYFLRRSVRLDPAYWACLAIALIAMPILFAVSRDNLSSLFEPFAPSAAMAAKNVFYFLPIRGELYVPVAWTLALEVHFYILFAALVVAVNHMESAFGVRREHTILTLVGTLLTAWVLTRLRIVPAEDGWLNYHLAGFVIGILAASLQRGIRYSGPALLIALLATSVMFFFLRETDIAATVLSGLVVVAAVFVPKLRTALSRSALLLRLGALSYCIYLLHQPIGGLTVEALQTFISRTSGPHQTVFVAIGIGTTVLCAAMVYKLIEVPSIALSKAIRPTGRRIIDARPPRSRSSDYSK